MKRLASILALTLSVMALANAQEVKKKAKVGAGLYEIVYNQKDDSVYVASIGRRGETGSAKIYRLDPKTLEVKGSIDVSAAAAFGLGLNEKTQTLYTSNTRDNSVHAIDLKTGKIIATINSGRDKSHTREVLVDEANNKVYISNMTDVWVIDGKTNKFSHIIDGTGEGTTGIALQPQKNWLFVTNMNANQISVVDLATNKVVFRFPSGGKSPINVVYDAKNNRLLVVNQGSGTMTALDDTGKLLQTVETGAGALSINFNPNKNLIYVTNRQAGTTSVIDGATYKVVSSLKSGTLPQSVAVDKKTGRIFVTNKAMGRPRPAEGQAASNQPAQEDPDGDVVTLIEP